VASRMSPGRTMRALQGPFHPEKAGANAKFGPVDDSDCRELNDLRWSDPLESRQTGLSL